MGENQFEFYFPFRVRYAEIDAQGIVFNGNYLTYFDTAIYEYFRALDFDFAGHCRSTGADFHTVHVDIDFLAPARFDEVIHVGVRTGKIGNSSLSFDLCIFCEAKKKILIKGTVIWVHADQETHASLPLPEQLVRLITDFEGI